MKFKFLIISFFIFLKVFATGQESNFIKIDGKEYQLLNDPLEKYFKDHPENHPVFGEKFIKKNENGEAYFSTSTGNWRGYVAYFEIVNNKLLLTDLKIQDEDSEKQISVFNKIFNENIELDYSGILTVPNGDYIDSDNFGFSNYYSNYFILTIKNDHLEKMKELKNEDYIKFKLKQFKEYQKTKEYKTEYQKYIKSNRESKRMDLSSEYTKDLSKEEIKRIKKRYAEKPTKEEIDGFLFMMSNLEQIYVYY